MAERPRRLHVVDGTFELFRAHFSKGPRREAQDGTDVTASYGTVRQVAALLDDPDEACTHVAVAFDNPIRSFRNDLFAGYKDGADVDPALRAQFDLVEQGVAALGVVVWSMDEHEADDAMATAAVRLRGEVEQVRLLTPDKDLGQVVGDGVVQVDRSRRREWDAEGVRERLGVPPSAVVDHLALVGDSADGIPGVPGIGRKTASALLGRYGSIAAVPSDPDSWDVSVRGAARIGAALREQRGEIALWRELATLVTDLDLPGCALDALRHSGPDRTELDRFAGLVRSDTLRAWRR